MLHRFEWTENKIILEGGRAKEKNVADTLVIITSIENPCVRCAFLLMLVGIEDLIVTVNFPIEASFLDQLNDLLLHRRHVTEESLGHTLHVCGEESREILNDSTLADEFIQSGDMRRNENIQEEVRFDCL